MRETFDAGVSASAKVTFQIGIRDDAASAFHTAVNDGAVQIAKRGEEGAGPT